MISDDAHSKSCDPQLLNSDPQENWGVDELGLYVRDQHQAIEAGEHVLTKHYWRLGWALNLARRHFSHGQWQRYLGDLGDR